ncbi:MAG: polyphosphate polymerase domain-containing protein [Oscillospiraceae bacterium]|nr:polyphosphate polymerase domain-containing protein [Oscillospiraceae bacterium]
MSTGPIVVMKRYELKYLLNAQQTAFLKERLRGHMELDEYGRTSIASLYYDTPDYRLIRTSIEKPPFKEKVRLRSYGLATDDSPVYLELKRKSDGVVYKRRVQTTIPLVKKFFDGDGDICAGGQINREITYFRDYYRTLAPACLIIYDREAYFEPGGDLRLTIDHNPRYRAEQLDLRRSMYGTSLLPEGHTILEIKVQQAMPLWLCSILSEGRIYKNSFSKYGEAYKQQLAAAGMKG